MAVNKPYTNQYYNIIKTPQAGSQPYKKVETDASQEYLDRLKAIDMRIKQTQALRESDMANIRRNTSLAQRDINDQMFREYLANRERMGGRGLTNSGLMADAQIRLNANKQDRLSELYGQQQDKLSEVHRLYAPQQTELLSERQGVRKSKIFQEMFDKVLERRAREAGMLAPLMQNEFTDEQRRKTETFTRNERINKQQFDRNERINSQYFTADENQKNRNQEKTLTEMRIAAEKAEGAANRAASANQGNLDRQLQLDKMEWEKTQDELVKTREGRQALANQYISQADSFQKTAGDMYANATSGSLSGDQYKEEMNRFAREKQKEQISRNLAVAYQSGDPKKINQALYEYNVVVLRKKP